MSPISEPQPPPPRPTDLTPRQLHFVPSPPVGWLSPQLLTATAVRVVGAQFFGAYMDKRELQGALPTQVYDHSADSDDDGDFWLDYISDLGDSFDATYSVAWLAAQSELEVAGAARGTRSRRNQAPAAPPTREASRRRRQKGSEPLGSGEERARAERDHEQGADGGDPVRLPRGRLTVLGGDAVYPTPGWRAYENRFRGPYRAALPVRPERPATLFALPGNHDWYDGLTAFLRVFAKDSWIGGWHTEQSRSYFAIQLPRRWWLFAVDTQLSNSYIDTPQLRYFEEAASRLKPGDRVLVCLAEPAWVKLTDSTTAYDPTDFFLRRIIRDTGASVHVLLAGDLHHYSRYELVGAAEPPEQPAEQPAQPEQAAHAEQLEQPERQPAGPPPDQTPVQMITCGGGGAFLADTAWLPERLQAPSPYTMARHAGPPHEYQLAERFPSKPKSRRYSLGVFHLLPLRNPGFGFAIGVIHTLLLFAFLTSQYRLLTFASVAMSGFVLASTIALAGGRRFVHRIVGGLHGLAHIGLGILGTLLWIRLPFHDWWAPWEVLAGVVLYGPVAGVVGTQLVAAYLLIAGRFSINTNELFASQGIKDSKCFLRIRIDAEGGLTVFPIGVDRICREWRATPDDPPESPWIAPKQPLRPYLLEDPINVDRQNG